MKAFHQFSASNYCQEKSGEFMKSQRIAWSCLQTARSSSTGNTCKHILPRPSDEFAITAQPVQAASGSEEQRIWCYQTLLYHQLSELLHRARWLAAKDLPAIQHSLTKIIRISQGLSRNKHPKSRLKLFKRSQLMNYTLLLIIFSYIS